MWRHLLMTPAAEAQRPLPWSLALLARGVVRPLYGYAVPHKLPPRGGGDADARCRCACPLYTLCVPKVSPYDACTTSVTATTTTAAAAAVSPPSALLSQSGSRVPRTFTLARLRSWRLWQRRRGRGSSNNNSSSNSSSVRAYAAVSNVLPGHAACYRCDICDGFCAHGGDARVPTLPLSSSLSPQRTTDVTGDADTTSTATTTGAAAADAVAAAQLRYRDPFCVAIAGRPPIAELTYRLLCQLMAQLRRCGVQPHELLRRSRAAARYSARCARSGEAWLLQQQQQQQSATRLHRDAALLADAVYAVRFAVAAYGLPYELGYFNSVQSLLKLLAEPHCRYVWATSEEHLASMRRMLHGGAASTPATAAPLLEFVHARYSLSCQASYAVVLDHAARRVVVAFRGTLTVAEALVDVMDGYETIELGSTHNGNNDNNNNNNNNNNNSSDGAVVRARVPRGLHTCVCEAATHVLPVLRRLARLHGDYEVVLTGHSLGGMHATLFHLLYCCDNNNDDTSDTVAALAPRAFRRVQTFAFGAAPTVEACALPALSRMLRRPPSPRGADDDDDSSSAIVTFVYGNDPVPRLQVRSLLDAFFTRDEETDSATTITRTTTTTSAADTATSDDDDDDDGGTHTTATTPARGVGDVPTLALPGAVYVLPCTSPRRRSSNSNNNSSSSSHSIGSTAATTTTTTTTTTAGGCAMVCVPANAAWRRQLVLSAEAAVHHFPVHYMRALARTLCAYQQQQQQQQQQQRSLPLHAPSSRDGVVATIESC